MTALSISRKTASNAVAALFLSGCIVFYAVFPLEYTSLLSITIHTAYFLPAFAVVAAGALLLAAYRPAVTRNPVFTVMRLILCVGGLVYAVELLGGSQVWRLASTNQGAFFYNCVLVTLLLTFFSGITGRTRGGIITAAVLLALYGYINHFTTMFRGSPVTPPDLFAAVTAVNVLPQYSFSVSAAMTEAFLVFAGVVLLAFAQERGAPRPWLRRVEMLGFSAFFLYLLSTLWIMEITSYRFAPHDWDQKVSALKNGSLVNLVSNIPFLIVPTPAGYSREAVNSIAARYPSDSVQRAQVKPDVIVILGESWANLAPEKTVTTNIPVLPHLSAFAGRADGHFGNLIVSGFGGGTSVAEFEVLTGASLLYGMSKAPLQNNVRPDFPGLAESFKRLGYETTALHTGTWESWGRGKAYPQMGFDTFLTGNDMPSEGERIRMYPPDSVLYAKCLSILETADKPQFMHVITLQTHGGFEDEQYQSPVKITKPQGDYPQTEQYLGLLRDADERFGQFIAALQKRERPTIVLAFGDHIPIVETAFFNKALKPASPLWQALTFYVLWANFPLEKDDPLLHSESLSTNVLGALVMHQAALPLTGYQKFLLDCAKEFPSTSAFGFVDKHGQRVPHSTFEKTSVFNMEKMFQYNLLYDAENLPQNFYTLQP